MNSDSRTIKILLRVWVVSLFINTLLGTAVITDLYTYAELIGPVAFLGLFYASVFTLPFVSLLLILLRQFLRVELAGRRLFSYFFSSGLIPYHGLLHYFLSNDWYHWFPNLVALIDCYGFQRSCHVARIPLNH